MKIEQEFNPITITLESQEEVDEMYAIFHTVSRTTGLDKLATAYNMLAPYATGNSATIQEKLKKELSYNIFPVKPNNNKIVES